VSDPTITFALDLPLEYEPVPTKQVVDGSPQTGLWEAESGEWGVWEMTPGAMRDVEVDEFFVVVAGERGPAEGLLGSPQLGAVVVDVVDDWQHDGSGFHRQVGGNGHGGAARGLGDDDSTQHDGCADDL